MSNEDALSAEELKELHVTAAWANFILFTRREVPFGEIKVKVVNGEPTDLVESKRRVRFDRPLTLPSVSISSEFNS